MSDYVRWLVGWSVIFGKQAKIHLCSTQVLSGPGSGPGPGPDPGPGTDPGPNLCPKQKCDNQSRSRSRSW